MIARFINAVVNVLVADSDDEEPEATHTLERGDSLVVRRQRVLANLLSIDPTLQPIANGSSTHAIEESPSPGEKTRREVARRLHTLSFFVSSPDSVTPTSPVHYSRDDTKVQYGMYSPSQTKA